jgi:mono/diheme cytochrome c family protein
MNKRYVIPCYITFLSLLVLALTSCRPGAATGSASATVTPFPTFGYVQRTEAPVVVTAGLETATASGTLALDADKVAQGKSRYEALACGDCHGDKAQGTAKGSALAGSKLTEDQFIDFLRTGGKLGNAHLYSTNRLSDTGGKNLYLYILSLSAGSNN